MRLPECLHAGGGTHRGPLNRGVSPKGEDLSINPSQRNPRRIRGSAVARPPAVWVLAHYYPATMPTLIRVNGHARALPWRP
jgi:hypothetical protein